MFLKPIKKSKAFVSEIKTKHGKPFTVKLTNVHIQDIFHLKEGNGQLLQVCMPTESSAFDTIRTLDEKALQETIQRKHLWFPQSALSKEKVLQYFRNSITHDTNTLSVVVSSLSEPTRVDWCGEPVECFEALLSKGKRSLREAIAHMTIEAEGLYFYGQKFGIRWVLRSISFTNSTMDGADNDESVDKHEIEAAWEEEMADLHEMMMDDIAMLEGKIQMIRDEGEVMNKLLKAAMDSQEMGQKWNDTLEELRERIAKYRSGML